MTTGNQDRITTREWLFTLSLATVAVVLAYVVADHTSGGFNVLVMLGYAVAFFAARLLTIRLPQGDEVSVTLIVGLVGLASVSPPLLLAASLAAGLADALARFAQSPQRPSTRRLRDALRAASVVGLLAPWHLVLRPLLASGGDADRIVVWALVAGVAYGALDLLTQGVEQSLSGGVSPWNSVASLLRPLSTVFVVHIAMAAVVLRLQPVSGGWPFPVAILLTLILQNSFNLYMRVRRAYSETIGALAHAAELDRPQDSGHARRVADLAVSVGRRIGLSSRELERIGYAALLHDIGRMGAVNEDRSGAHADRGAEIASSIPFLADVAPLIRCRSEEEDEAAPVGWVIVRTCSRYDRLRNDLGGLVALDVLMREEVISDDRVIEALRETLGLSGVGSGELL